MLDSASIVLPSAAQWKQSPVRKPVTMSMFVEEIVTWGGEKEQKCFNL